MRQRRGESLEFLEDLEEAEYNDCLKAVHSEWMKNGVESRSGAERVYCGARVRKDKGPASYAQRTARNHLMLSAESVRSRAISCSHSRNEEGEGRFISWVHAYL